MSFPIKNSDFSIVTLVYRGYFLCVFPFPKATGRDTAREKTTRLWRHSRGLGGRVSAVDINGCGNRGHNYMICIYIMCVFKNIYINNIIYYIYVYIYIYTYVYVYITFIYIYIYIYIYICVYIYVSKPVRTCRIPSGSLT